MSTLEFQSVARQLLSPQLVMPTIIVVPLRNFGLPESPEQVLAVFLLDSSSDSLFSVL